MLPQVFLPLPKHQHCKLSYGMIDSGIYIWMPLNKCMFSNAFGDCWGNNKPSNMWRMHPWQTLGVNFPFQIQFTINNIIGVSTHRPMQKPTHGDANSLLSLSMNFTLFVSFAISKTSLSNSKLIMHLWKINSIRKLKCFSLTIVVNLHLKKLMHFVNYMALFDNLNFKSCAISIVLIVCKL